MAYDLPSNFTNWNNVSTSVGGIGSLFQYADYATNSAFGLGLISLIWIVAFGASVLMSFSRAFISASFITLIFSIYFTRIGLLTSTAPFILLVMTIVGFFLAKSDRGSNI